MVGGFNAAAVAVSMFILILLIVIATVVVAVSLLFLYHRGLCSVHSPCTCYCCSIGHGRKGKLSSKQIEHYNESPKFLHRSISTTAQGKRIDAHVS